MDNIFNIIKKLKEKSIIKNGDVVDDSFHFGPFCYILVQFGPFGIFWSIPVLSVYFGLIWCTYLRMRKDSFGLKISILNMNLLTNIDEKKYYYYF